MIFENVKNIVIPQGTVKNIISNGVILWKKLGELIRDSFVNTYTIEDGESIESLVQYGKCEQVDTPTPTAPADIKCNNGTIMLSPNLFRTTATSKTQAGVRYEVLPDGRIQCTGTATGYSDIAVGRATVNSEMGIIRVVVNGTYGAPGNIVVNGIGLYNSGGTKIASLTYNIWTQYATVDLSEYPTVDTVRVEIKRNSNGETNAIIAVSVTVGSEAVSWYQYGVPIIKGTREAITLGQQTARAQNLLGVGDYADIQNIISGEVTRKVGVKILDGTEEWETDTYGGNRRFVTRNFAKEQLSTVICTHYNSTVEDGVRTSPNNAYVAATGALAIYRASTQSIDTVADWTAYLAAQYTNGTPVIVLYLLAIETTESVTGQSLTLNNTTNTISVTAEVDDIDFDIEYREQV